MLRFIKNKRAARDGTTAQRSRPGPRDTPIYGPGASSGSLDTPLYGPGSSLYSGGATPYDDSEQTALGPVQEIDLEQAQHLPKTPEFVSKTDTEEDENLPLPPPPDVVEASQSESNAVKPADQSQPRTNNDHQSHNVTPDDNQSEVRRQAARIVDDLMDDVTMVTARYDVTDSDSDVTGTTIRSNGGISGPRHPPPEHDQERHYAVPYQHKNGQPQHRKQQHPSDPVLSLDRVEPVLYSDPPHRRSITPASSSNSITRLHPHPHAPSPQHPRAPPPSLLPNGSGYYTTPPSRDRASPATSDSSTGYSRSSRDYPRMGYARRMRTPSHSNSFRLAMNPDGTVAVVPGPMIPETPLETPFQNGGIPHHNGNVIREESPTDVTDEGIPNRHVHFYRREPHTTGKPRRVPHMAGNPHVNGNPYVVGSPIRDDDVISVTSSTSVISQSELRPSRLRVRRSIALCLAWICLGLSYEVAAAMLDYFTLRLDITLHELSWALSSRGGACMFGAVIGCLVCYKLADWRDLWLCLALIMMALSSAVTPWCNTLLYLCLALALMGVAKGFLILVSLLFAHHLWSGSGAHTLIFILFAFYHIGALGTTFLSELFNDTSHIITDIGQIANDSTSLPPIHDTNATYRSSLEALHSVLPQYMYPMSICATLAFLCSALFLGLFAVSLKNMAIFVPPDEPKSKASASEATELLDVKKLPSDAPNKDTQGPEKPSKEKDAGTVKPAKGDGCKCCVCPCLETEGGCTPRFLLYLLVLLCIPSGVALSLGHYLRYYFKLDTFEDVNYSYIILQSIWWASGAVGCLLCPAARRCGLAANGLLIPCFTLSLLSSSIVCIYGETYPLLTWIFTPLWALAVAPVVPLALTYANVYLRPTPGGLCVAVAAIGVGDGLLSWGAPFVLVSYRLPPLMYLWISAAGFCFVFYVPLLSLLAGRKWRVNKSNMASKKGKQATNKHKEPPKTKYV